MRRLFFAVLIALSLVGGPVAAVAAPPPDCTMKAMTGMPGHPARQSKMDCCALGCLFAAAALLPEQPAQGAVVERLDAEIWSASVPGLRSVNPSALDPPPRPSSN